MTYLTEYRINKKGAECFRTCNREEAYGKFNRLAVGRPGVYSIQYRTTPLNKFGAPAQLDYKGRPVWSAWRT